MKRILEYSSYLAKSELIISSGITNAREAMKKLSEEDRAKIEQHVEVFRIEKRAFDNEVCNSIMNYHPN